MRTFALIILLLWACSVSADVIKNDTFTEGSTTPLENHTADSGGNYRGAHVSLYSVGSDGRIFREGQTTTQGFVAADDDPSETHYFAELKGITLGGTATSDEVNVFVRSNQTNDGATNDFFEVTTYELFHRGSDGWRLARTVPSVSRSFLAFDTNYNSNNSVGIATVIDLKLEVETIDASTVRLTASIALDGGGYSVVATEDDTSVDRIEIAGNPGYNIKGNVTASEFNSEDFLQSGTGLTLIRRRR